MIVGGSLIVGTAIIIFVTIVILRRTMFATVSNNGGYASERLFTRTPIQIKAQAVQDAFTFNGMPQPRYDGIYNHCGRTPSGLWPGCSWQYNHSTAFGTGMAVIPMATPLEALNRSF